MTNKDTIDNISIRLSILAILIDFYLFNPVFLLVYSVFDKKCWHLAQIFPM